MRNKSKLVLVLVFLCSGIFAAAQITIRDHRKDKTKWVPVTRPPRTITPGPDTDEIPVALNSFSVDPQYRQEISFKGNGWGGLANSPYQVFFCNKLVFGNGSLYTTAEDSKKEILFYADTLQLDGLFNLDFSSNIKNQNGFLMIACRVLNINSARLNINLGKPEQGKYRKFYFFTEQVLLKGQKPPSETNALAGGFSVQKFNSGHWERLRAGEPPPTNWPPGVQPQPGYKFVSTVFDPFCATVGFLPTMIEKNEGFYNFFSRWVASSYQDLYTKIIRDVNGFDKMPAVKDFIQFIALNNYNQLEPASKAQCTQWIEKISPYRAQVFKDGFQFERIVAVGGRNIKLMGAVTESGLVYYLQPSFSLINASVVNGKTISGYHVFDETQPNVSILDFDIILSSDTRLKNKIQSQYLGYKETISNGFEEMQFTNLTVSGPDVIPNQTKVTLLSNNGFNVRLAVTNGSILLFNRLFSTISSDIYLTGKWSNRNSSITGDMKVPLSFTKQYNPPLEWKARTIFNRSSIPANVEFYMLDKKYLMELSPALQIDSAGSYPEAYVGADKFVSIPSDAISFKLNPEKFGNYFEQIDNSDKLTQELFFENHIAPTALDSTGYLQYVQIIASYEIAGKTYSKKVQLSSANTLGSTYLLVIPKSSKDPVTITITGRAFYENAEYDIEPVRLINGEAEFNLEEKHLKNKIR